MIPASEYGDKVGVAIIRLMKFDELIVGISIP